MKPLHLLSAIELRDLFFSGSVSAVQITSHFLERIKQHNEKLGAFLSVLGPRALERSEQLDHKRARGEPLGRLAAIPVAIKDNMHINGEITTCGSRFLSNYRAPFDSTVVRLLEQEDAICLGKTNLDEFAMGSSTENSAYGPVRNPWNLGCVPGGSSGGSAAAVAARLCLLATGSDTGGSIRQPASLCGLVGFKPTYGRVSRYGLVAFGSSLDQFGPLATTSADAALMMEVIGRHCPSDGTSIDLPAENYLSALPSDLKGLSIGIPFRFLESLTEEPRKNFDAAVEKLRSLGAQIVDVDLDILRYSIAVYYILATAEASTNLARFDGIRYGNRAAVRTLEEIYNQSRKEGFGREVKRRIMLGTYVLSAGYQDAFYKKAQKVRTRIIEAFEEAFQTCDFIATPTTSGGTFPLGSVNDPLQLYLQDIFTVPANLAGLPSVSVPSGFDSKGHPLGLQLTGPQLQDVATLRTAHLYERATHFTDQHPKAFA